MDRGTPGSRGEDADRRRTSETQRQSGAHHRGGRGIGRGIAEVFADEGADVAVNDLDCGNGAPTPWPSGCEGKVAARSTVKADVARRDEVEPMIDRVWSELGPIDILVNNAGIETIVPFLDLTDDQWTRLVDANLRGAWLCSQVFCRRALAEGRAGQHRQHRIDPGGESAAGPHALRAGQARARGADAQHVGGDDAARHPRQLRPSRADRDRHDRLGDEGSRTFCPCVLAQISLGRAGQPREIGAVAAFFASDEASYLTGQSIHVDGGWEGK